MERGVSAMNAAIKEADYAEMHLERMADAAETLNEHGSEERREARWWRRIALSGRKAVKRLDANRRSKERQIAGRHKVQDGLARRQIELTQEYHAMAKDKQASIRQHQRRVGKQVMALHDEVHNKRTAAVLRLKSSTDRPTAEMRGANAPARSAGGGARGAKQGRI